MRRKRRKDQSIGIFDVPDRSVGDDEIAVLGGATGDSALFGGPSHSSGLFDVPDRPPGGTHLFDRPHRAAGEGAGLPDKSARAVRGGLFDKPAPRRK